MFAIQITRPGIKIIILVNKLSWWMYQIKSYPKCINKKYVQVSFTWWRRSRAMSMRLILPLERGDGWWWVMVASIQQLFLTFVYIFIKRLSQISRINWIHTFNVVGVIYIWIGKMVIFTNILTRVDIVWLTIKSLPYHICNDYIVIFTCDIFQNLV